MMGTTAPWTDDKGERLSPEEMRARMTEQNGRLFDSWHEWAEGEYSPNSVPSLQTGLMQWILWCQADDFPKNAATVAEAEKSHLMRYVDSIKNDLAGVSIRSHVTAVSSFYRWAGDRDILDATPTDGFSLSEDFNAIDDQTPEMTRQRREAGVDGTAVIALKPETVQRIAEHPGSPRVRNELIIRLLWQTGVRSVELANVTLDDIDTDKRSIDIRTAKTDPGDPNYQRTVYYDESLDYLLTEWMDYGERDSLPPAEDSEYLLLTRQSEQMRPSHISRIVKRAAKRVGDDENGVNHVVWTDAAGKKRWFITAHRLRHSYATYVANETDVPIHILSELLGHRKLDTTLKYVSTDDDVLRKNATEAVSSMVDAMHAGN
jgi:integrase/recombinase XerD